MTAFECWEFFGAGDQFFGGSADDRVLYRLPDGSASFLRSWERGSHPGATRALFGVKDEALQAGRALARSGARVSAIQAREG